MRTSTTPLFKAYELIAIVAFVVAGIAMASLNLIY